jgi:alginate O-acetyltransferase complex protein AlgI
MIFHTLIFLAFFVIYFLLHLIVPVKYRVALIIAGSTIFYGYWNPNYIWVPYLLTFMSYIGALWIDKTAGDVKRLRLLLVISILTTPLLVVKYSHFIYNDVLCPMFNLDSLDLKLSLPLGLSFITFTAIAYVADVYRQRFPVEKRLSRMTALVLFFPHLIAGPILRPHDLLPAFEKPWDAKRAFSTRFTFGFILFSLGLLKKLFFADSLATWVDHVYSTSAAISAYDYLLAIYGFSLQIYCDFSGYTDMALGLAISLGVKLPNNFYHPYTARSLVEFWRCWHISLSNWLRDYIYISLGGNRVGYVRQAVNIFVTMTIGGLWHGASWTFILWGMLHGAGIAVVHGLRKLSWLKILFQLPKWLYVVLTFHFVSFAWILFRAPNMSTATRVMMGPFTAPLGNLNDFFTKHLFLIIIMAVFYLTHRWDAHRTIRQFIKKLPPYALWIILGFCWMLALTMNVTSSNKFIYYDF